MPSLGRSSPGTARSAAGERGGTGPARRRPFRRAHESRAARGAGRRVRLSPDPHQVWFGRTPGRPSGISRRIPRGSVEGRRASSSLESRSWEACGGRLPGREPPPHHPPNPLHPTKSNFFPVLRLPVRMSSCSPSHPTPKPPSPPQPTGDPPTEPPCRFTPPPPETDDVNSGGALPRPPPPSLEARGPPTRPVQPSPTCAPCSTSSDTTCRCARPCSS